MPASRQTPSLGEQCLAQLTYFETHSTLENVRKLSEIALECKLGHSLLQDLTGHLRMLRSFFSNQLQFAPTLPGDDFIHLVGTVDEEPTHIYIQERAGFKNVVTVTVHTVESHHDVDFVFLTNNVHDISYFVVDYLDKTASSFSHLPTERTPQWARIR
jgi:hypothetical protein